MLSLPHFLILFSTLFAMQGALTDGVGVWSVPRAAHVDLAQMQAAVRHGRPDRDFTALLTEEQVAELQRRGHVPVLLFASTRDEHASEADAAWTSYATMRSDFLAYAATYPTLASYEVLGTSVQGRELFGLRISANVTVEEDEPEVVFWGSIHGDEFASAEVPYEYAMYLLDNYGVDVDVTRYVDETEIWCIPLVNPDGHEAGTRNNANNVDLNRDYGFQWDGWGGSSRPHSEVETRAVREFCLANNISLASTMHCSGNVFLHPWGFGPNARDAATIQAVGGVYATLANYTLLSSWVSYETHGELVDYLYGSHGGLIYTAEISNSRAQYPTTYSRNAAGMDAFCDLAGGGLHGVVTDANTGEPVWAAVWVSGLDVPAYTDPTVGDVHRLLAPGTYDVTVWANGYLPQTITGVSVGPLTHAPAEFTAALQPTGDTHAFLVTAVNQDDPNNEYANTSAPASALGAPDGVACSLGAGGFIVLDMGPDHVITDGPGDDFTVTEAVLFDDVLPEAYAVFAGDAYAQTQLVGTGFGTTSFDLAAAGLGSTRYLKIVDDSGADPDGALAGLDLDAVTVAHRTQSYCTAGTSASGCQAQLTASGTASATAATGFHLLASGVEGAKDGLYFFATNGRQANPWGNGTSVQCVVPPVQRAGLLTGTGTPGLCDGTFSQDLNARWTTKPNQNPGAGALVQAQLWYRDPMNTSNQTTSLSGGLEFLVAP